MGLVRIQKERLPVWGTYCLKQAEVRIQNQSKLARETYFLGRLEFGTG